MENANIFTIMFEKLEKMKIALLMEIHTVAARAAPEDLARFKVSSGLSAGINIHTNTVTHQSTNQGR